MDVIYGDFIDRGRGFVSDHQVRRPQLCPLARNPPLSPLCQSLHPGVPPSRPSPTHPDHPPAQPPTVLPPLLSPHQSLIRPQASPRPNPNPSPCLSSRLLHPLPPRYVFRPIDRLLMSPLSLSNYPSIRTNLMISTLRRSIR